MQNVSIKTETGAYFIDRDPEAFAAILKYLRTREVFPSYKGVSLKEVATEAVYFGVDELAAELGGSGWCSSKSKEVLIVFPSLVHQRSQSGRQMIEILAVKLDGIGNHTYILSDATEKHWDLHHRVKRYSKDCSYQTENQAADNTHLFFYSHSLSLQCSCPSTYAKRNSKGGERGWC